MTKQRAFEIAVAAYRACAAKGCPDCQKDMAAFYAAQKAAEEPPAPRTPQDVVDSMTPEEQEALWVSLNRQYNDRLP
jgi:hypothetical protein